MPAIPEFQPAAAIPVVRDTVRADPGALALPGREQAAEGAQLQRTGGAIEGVGEAMGRLQAFKNEDWAANQWADATVKTHDRMLAEQQAARESGNYGGFTAKIHNDASTGWLDQDLAQRIENAPSTHAADMLRRHFATLTDQVTTRGSDFEHQMTAQQSWADRQQRYQDFQNQIYRDPSRAGDLLAQGDALIDVAARHGTLDPEAAERERQNFRQGVGMALALNPSNGLRSGNGAAMAADIKSGKYDRYFNARDLERLQPELSRATAEGAANDEASRMFGGGSREIATNNFAGMRAPDVPAGGGPNTNPRGWQQFTTPEAGVAAISHQLDRYASGATSQRLTGKATPLDTIRQIVATWAPPSDHNDTAALIDRASRVTGFDPDQKLDMADPATKAKLIEAMIRGEQGGRLPVDPAIIAKVAGAPPPAAQADSSAPDLNGAIARIQGRVAGGALTPEEGDAAIGHLTRRYHEWSQATAQERAQLVDTTKNGIAALAAGQDWTPDPAAIRRLLPPEQASETLRTIGEAQDEGNAVNRIKFATPQEIAQQRATIAEGLKDPTDFARKQRFATAFNTAVAKRDSAIKADPAAYAAQAPDVAAAWQATANPADPDNPAPEYQRAVQASLTEQERLGVAPEDRSALPKPVAASLVQAIVGADPAKTDTAAALDGMAKRYGPVWPQAFGSLVKAGLPGEYQVLATMISEPDENGIVSDNQAVPRTQFQRMLALTAEKGGPEQLKRAAPAAAVALIGQGLDAALDQFRATVRDPKLYDVVRTSVERLAQYYAYQGVAGDQALKGAYDGIIGRKFDFDGTIRAPKGQLGIVERAGNAVLGKIDVAALPDIGGNQDLTPDQRRGIYLSAIQNGDWRVNEDSTGLVRYARFRDGLYIPAKRADSSLIEVPFKQAASLAASTPLVNPPWAPTMETSP